ncbi:glycosyltransferase family 4 protein [Janibacter sp. UYMM211]|uniref:glycosyltransferase family 4 protein n=1 Tax=Janibacter sp. UYMM211 TaxID=3156342 RepID=UPI003398E827
MRILLLTHHYHPEMGAPQQRWAGLVESFVAAGHQVAVLTPPPHYPSGQVWPDEERYAPGVVHRGEHGEVVHRVTYRQTTGDVWSLLSDQVLAAVHSVLVARRFRGDGRPDVVVTTVPALPSLVAGVVTSRLLRRPLVVEMRDAWPDLLAVIDQWDGAPVRRQRTVKRALARIAAVGTSTLQRQASVVVTTTHSFAERLRERRFRHVRVVRNAAHPFTVDGSHDVEPEDGVLKVVYVGTVGRAQGLETAVAAVRLARLRGVEVALRVVGGGAGRRLVQMAAAQAGVEVDVRHAVPRSEVPDHYAWADTALVMLRDWPGLHLTIPSKVYELMSAGLHITASVSGEAADVVRDSGAGDVVPAADPDALADLWVRLARASTRPTPSERAVDWVRTHATRDVIGEQYLALLGDMHVVTGARGVGARGRASTLARNVALLARTGAEHLHDDPVTFAVLVSRRMPPSIRGSVADALLQIGSRPDLTALAHVLADRPEDARQVLAQAEPSRLVDELELVVDGTTRRRGRAQARALWQAGHLSEAIEGLTAGRGASDQRYATRLCSERMLLQPGRTITVDPPTSPRVSGRRLSVTHVLTNSLPHTSSGYALRTHSILQAQRAAGIAARGITRPGYPVTIGSVAAPATSYVDAIPYHRVLHSRLPQTVEGRLELWAADIASLSARSGADVLHATTHYPNAMATQAAARSLGVPWVYEMRGQLEKTWAASRPGELSVEALGSERYRLWRAKEIEMACAADAVVTLSESMRDDLVSRGVPAERVTLAPNAVDATLLVDAPPAAQARERLGLPTDGVWVGTVSSIVGYEGLHTLVDAIALARRGGVDVRGAIVGDGVARPALVEQVRRLGLEDHVVLPGRVSRGAARLWHQALDVFVVPRVDSEVTRTVTPLKPIEAMAIGRPVIASDLPALAEIVEAPGSGVLVPAGDVDALAQAVDRLARDRDLRGDLGLHGRLFAETRTWSALAHRYEELYRTLSGREVR